MVRKGLGEFRKALQLDIWYSSGQQEGVGHVKMRAEHLGWGATDASVPEAE